MCCNSWGRKESDMTERLDWTGLTETDSNIVPNFKNCITENCLLVAFFSIKIL